MKIDLPTSGCGVRLITKDNDRGQVIMFYTVTLVAQQDKYLRQISDSERIIECIVSDSAFLIKSKPMRDVIKKDLFGIKKGSNR